MDNLLYNPVQYAEDKLIGKRTSAGDKPLRKLTARHKAVLAMHLSGRPSQEIASLLGCPQSWVNKTLRDPLVKEIVSRGLEMVDDELAALFPLSVDALRVTLTGGTEGGKLRAAEMVLKSQGKHEKPQASQETAEDVIGRMMARITVEGKAIIEVGTQISGRDAQGS